jgi:hypothetical protein
MSRKKEHADLLPRERKTANCFEALEAIHNRSQPDRRPAADELQLHAERLTLTCQAIARPHDGCHRACKQPKPARSTAMPVMKDSHHNDRRSRRSRHSQLNTTTSRVSRSPVAPLLRLVSADSRKRNTMHRPASANEILSVRHLCIVLGANFKNNIVIESEQVGRAPIRNCKRRSSHRSSALIWRHTQDNRKRKDKHSLA